MRAKWKQQIWLVVFLCFVGVNLAHGQATPVPAPSPTPAPLAEGRIGTVSFTGLHAIDEEIVRAVVNMEPGEAFTPEKLGNTINDLKDWGVFSEVEVLVESENSITNLTFELKEGFVIKDVSIDGNYPLLETAVRRSLFLNAGQIYDPARLPEQIERLDKLYDREGYFRTTILAIEEYEENKREVSLRFKIQKGRTYRTRDVEIKGNTALDPKKIRGIIYTWSHYKPRVIQKNLEKIQKLYKKNGYVRARVKLVGENYDYDAREVDVNIAIRQGKRVFVQFQGNDRYRARTLRKKLTIYEYGDYDEYELEASQKKLVEFYESRGFENVQVNYLRQKLDDENYLVTFQIQEGQQTKIMKIDFAGNDELKPGTLKDIMQSKEESFTERGYYYKPLVDQDMQSLKNYFNNEGFLDSDVQSWEKEYNEFGDKAILTINLNEKPRALVNELNINGISGDEKDRVLPDLLLQPGRPYSPIKLEQDLEAILVMLADRGYPYAQIKPDPKNIRDNLWDVNLQVEKGDKVTIGDVLFVGNSLTKETTIRQNLRVKEGDTFSARRLLRSQINLRRLGIFDAVAIETLGLANKEETVQVVVRVQEKKTKIIDLEGGYSTDFGFHGKFIFNKLNIWGSGKNANIKVQAGQEISRFEINYVDPRIKGSSLQLLIGAFVGYENRPFFKNFGTGAYSTLYKDLTSRLSAFGRLEFEFVDFDETNTVISVLRPPEATDDRTRLKTTVGTIYDRRDNFGNPSRGYYLSGNFTLTNQFIQRSGNYITLNGSAGYWYTPMRRLTIANSLRIANIFPIPGNTNVPVDDRLYLGGDDTVRGFSQDSLLPTGGLFSLVYNLELQFNLFKNFQVVGFLDNGTVTNSITQVSLFNLRHSAGPGIRYLTPVGPIRLEYGIKLDRRPGEGLGRLHFSFGYFF